MGAWNGPQEEAFMSRYFVHTNLDIHTAWHTWPAFSVRPIVGDLVREEEPGAAGWYLTLRVCAVTHTKDGVEVELTLPWGSVTEFERRYAGYSTPR